VHIWAYESLDERTKRRAALYEDAEWLADFVPKAFPMLLSQESKLLIPAPFSPIR
jgi:NIPSNAP